MGAEPGASNLQTDLALAYARHGDTLAVVRLDRLGRSLGELLPAQAVISLTLSVKRTPGEQAQAVRQPWTPNGKADELIAGREYGQALPWQCQAPDGLRRVPQTVSCGPGLPI